MMKTTVQSVIWVDTEIRVIVKTTAQSVIWVDTYIPLILETTVQSVIWADTEIRLTVKTTAQSVRRGGVIPPPPPSPEELFLPCQHTLQYSHSEGLADYLFNHLLICIAIFPIINATNVFLAILWTFALGYGLFAKVSLGCLYIALQVLSQRYGYLRDFFRVFSWVSA